LRTCPNKLVCRQNHHQLPSSCQPGHLHRAPAATYPTGCSKTTFNHRCARLCVTTLTPQSWAKEGCIQELRCQYGLKLDPSITVVKNAMDAYLFPNLDDPLIAYTLTCPSMISLQGKSPHLLPNQSFAFVQSSLLSQNSLLATSKAPLLALTMTFI